MGENIPSPKSDEVSDSWQAKICRWFGRRWVSRSESMEIVQSMGNDGGLDKDTIMMMEGAIRISELQVRDIMVPRAQMVVIEEDSDWREVILPIIIETGHSRFPLVDHGKDEITGILLAKETLRYLGQMPDTHWLHSIARKPTFVPESKRVNVLLKEFRSSRNHMAIVVDEFGGVAGLITLEDVIEEIVGDIDDEHDQTIENRIIPHHNRYLVQALTPVDEFNSYFGSDFSDTEFDTIGGLIVQCFGHVPKKGENITIKAFEFMVHRSDGRRVHQLLVKPATDLKPPGSDAR